MTYVHVHDGAGLEVVKLFSCSNQLSMYRSGRHEDNFSMHPLRYLWVNDYKGNGISGRDHYIFCSSVMLGTAGTA